ncbi:MAG: hypothetical protein IPP48_10105 [Chitinophagaceae bacterium]|nr:hypothetical protein [Chitinophagaceae bacterium]
MDWAISMYPDDSNLFDSMGEFQNSIGNKEQANKYYEQGLKIIEAQKTLLQENIYQDKTNWFKSKIAETK